MNNSHHEKDYQMHYTVILCFIYKLLCTTSTDKIQIKNLHFIKTSIFKNLDIGALQESKQEHEQQFIS